MPAIWLPVPALAIVCRQPFDTNGPVACFIVLHEPNRVSHRCIALQLFRPRFSESALARRFQQNCHTDKPYQQS